MLPGQMPGEHCEFGDYGSILHAGHHGGGLGSAAEESRQAFPAHGEGVSRQADG